MTTRATPDRTGVGSSRPHRFFRFETVTDCAARRGWRCCRRRGTSSLVGHVLGAARGDAVGLHHGGQHALTGVDAKAQEGMAYVVLAMPTPNPRAAEDAAAFMQRGWPLSTSRAAHTAESAVALRAAPGGRSHRAGGDCRGVPVATMRTASTVVTGTGTTPRSARCATDRARRKCAVEIAACARCPAACREYRGDASLCSKPARARRAVFIVAHRRR
jgi:hypothetical protein